MNSEVSSRPAGGFYVVGIAGSLRRGSFNRALLAAAQELAPATLRITARDLSTIPLYNADLEENGLPGPVVQLRDSVREADAVLFVTPEYNHGMSGVLKNALDWLSRPPRASALHGKPAAIMGATPGMVGTARAQDQLRQAFIFTNTFAMIQPEVLVNRAHEKFDKSGRLTDETTRQFLSKFLERFEQWIARFRAQVTS
ncbi:MAG TPA: NADPH-dependent FMN reductase [Candidatus Sulfotelmatobacter sp.]|nr:NADPH-dependent FMN reductase [Candidatus Sulfotelmatobacter sp.]